MNTWVRGLVTVSRLGGFRRRRDRAGRLGERSEKVTFGPAVADSHGLGADAEGAEAAGEARFVERFPAVGSGPGAVWQGTKGSDQGTGKEAVGGGLGEDEADVGQEGKVMVLGGIGLGIETGEGGGGALGPVAADDLSDGEERPPIVGYAVERGGGQDRIAGGQRVEIVDGPAGEFAGQRVFEVGVVFVEAGDDLSGLGGHEGDEDGSVMKGGGERADAGQSGRSESPEGAEDVARALATVAAT